MDAAGLKGALEKGTLATRRAYGAALKVAGGLLPQVVALDGDVSNSTFSEMFAKAYPERFFECKIAEQNMVSTAAGLSAAGFIPFCNSFAKFIGRAYDQVEMANISRANLKLVGSHAGASLAADGPSQMGLMDVAFFRGFTTVRGDDRSSPLGWLFQPADAVAAYHLTRLMLEMPGMCYMRTHRPDVPLLYAADAKFEPGGFNVLRPGDDVALVASGYMVFVAREAAALLGRQNIRATVIDAYCLPIDGPKLIDALRRAGGKAIVVEDNYGGGFGAAVAEAAARAAGPCVVQSSVVQSGVVQGSSLARTGGAGACNCIRVETLHCQRIPKSALTPEEELECCGVGPKQIADHALALLKRPA
jgi:transketolase